MTKHHPANTHTNQRRARRLACALVAVLCCWGSLYSHAAILGNGAPQQTVDGIAIPVTLFPAQGDTIASMQFSLIYDTRAFALAGAIAGPAAAQAGKDVIYAQHNGSATIIIAGFNQDILQGGLVATVYLQPLGDLTLPNAVNIQSAVFSDPLGQAIVRRDPGNNPTKPDPSTPPDPVIDDDKSTPPPTDPVDNGDPEPNTPGSNYVNPGYGARYVDEDTFGENKANTQARDNSRKDAANSTPINGGSGTATASGLAGGGGALPGAPSERQPYENQSGTGITLQLPQNVATASPPVPVGRPGFARNTGMPTGTPDISDDTAAASGTRRSGVPGAMASNTFQNGTQITKLGLNLDSNPSARVPSGANGAVPLLLALIVATLFAGGAYYWRQAAPRARR